MITSSHCSSPALSGLSIAPPKSEDLNTGFRTDEPT